jgi:hypothetical protein
VGGDRSASEPASTYDSSIIDVATRGHRDNRHRLRFAAELPVAQRRRHLVDGHGSRDGRRARAKGYVRGLTVGADHIDVSFAITGKAAGDPTKPITLVATPTA